MTSKITPYPDSLFFQCSGDREENHGASSGGDQRSKDAAGVDTHPAEDKLAKDGSEYANNDIAEQIESATGDGSGDPSGSAADDEEYSPVLYTHFTSFCSGIR